MIMMIMFSHLSRLLVGVGHKATHKVGLAVVQGGLQKYIIIRNARQDREGYTISSPRETR